MSTTHRSIKQTHAQCSQICPHLKNYFHKDVSLREARGPIEYQNGMESLRVVLIYAPADIVIANFSDAMYSLTENVTPARSLDVHFPYVILQRLKIEVSYRVMNTLCHLLVHYVTKGRQYRTRIRLFFEDFLGYPTSRNVIAMIAHDILESIDVDLRAIYRGESIGAAEVMEIMNLN